MSSIEGPHSNAAAVIKTDLLKFLPNLRAFAVSLCGDVTQADDLVQDTIVKAWEHHAKFEPGTNLKAWLLRSCETPTSRVSGSSGER